MGYSNRRGTVESRIGKDGDCSSNVIGGLGVFLVQGSSVWIRSLYDARCRRR